MRANINFNHEVDFSDIMIGNKTLYHILWELKREIHETVFNISIERQRDTPNLEFIDVSLYIALTKLEELGFN